MNADFIAEQLARVTPEDAGSKERYDAHWIDANKFAAAELIKNLPSLREKAKSDSSKLGVRAELARLAVKEGRRIRNDYLAKAG